MTLAALVRQDMFLGVAVEPAVGRPGPVVPDVLGPTDTEAIARVESYMEEQEPFLDPSLTIRSLARRLGMGKREVSDPTSGGQGKGGSVTVDCGGCGNTKKK